jgi:ribonucleoside-diphosphate reductase alpha chain
MWDNRNGYSGISLLPYDGGTYKQAPFEDCSKELYEEMLSSVKDIDLKQVKEDNDNTNRIEQLACVGGNCEIT